MDVESTICLVMDVEGRNIMATVILQAWEYDTRRPYRELQ